MKQLIIHDNIMRFISVVSEKEQQRESDINFLLDKQLSEDEDIRRLSNILLNLMIAS
jgi:hypothetical protein